MASPGIILTSKFIVSTSRKFKSYVDYIDRKEAIRNDAYNRYSLYNDYMGNPTKTTGLFNSDVNFMSEAEKKGSKKLFEEAQKNESIMWQDVYSFDNKWLAKHGLYNPITKELDEEKIKDAVRKSTDFVIKKDNLLESAVWNGAIHYNTDNIHIHVAICEPKPTTNRGKRTQKTLDNMKSNFTNELLNNKENYQEINNNIRKDIVNTKKDFSSFNDKEMKKLFFNIIKNLPKDERHWHYDYNTMSDSKVYLNKMTEHYIKTYKEDEFKELCKKLDKQEEILKEVYGVGKREKYKDYKQNKIDELYKRMGNTILTEVKEYIKEEKKINKISKGKKYQSNSKSSLNILDRCISKKNLNEMKKALSNDFDSIKNMNYYEQLQAKIDNEIEL